jgi:hypothetical protein
MDRTQRRLTMTCPQCHTRGSLDLTVSGTWDCFGIDMLTQSCRCDTEPFWEDLWEQAREMAFQD